MGARNSEYTTEWQEGVPGWGAGVDAEGVKLAGEEWAGGGSGPVGCGDGGSAYAGS